MLVTIERIEIAGPDRRARRLVLSDADEPRVTAASVLRECALEAGESIDSSDLEALLADVELKHAKDRALQLLSYRDRSYRELDGRLSDDGYPRTVREAVVGRLVEVGLVDDERFASAWVRSRATAGMGNRRIASELRQRGIEDDVICRAIEELDLGDEADRALSVLRGATAANRKERDKLVRRLVAKGFGLQTAVAAVEKSVSDDEWE